MADTVVVDEYYAHFLEFVEFVNQGKANVHMTQFAEMFHAAIEHAREMMGLTWSEKQIEQEALDILCEAYQGPPVQFDSGITWGKIRDFICARSAFTLWAIALRLEHLTEGGGENLRTFYPKEKPSCPSQIKTSTTNVTTNS